MGHEYNLYMSPRYYSRGQLTTATRELIVMDEFALSQYEYKYGKDGIPSGYDLVPVADDEVLFTRTLRMRKVAIDCPRNHGLLTSTVTWLMRKHGLSSNLRGRVTTDLWWVRMSQAEMLETYDIYVKSAYTQTKTVKNLSDGGLFRGDEKAAAAAVQYAEACELRLMDTMGELSKRAHRNEYFYVRRD